MERPETLAARQLRIPLGGEPRECVAFLERHDRIDERIQALDLREIRVHDFDAGDLPRMNGFRERQRVEVDNVRLRRRGRHRFQGRARLRRLKAKRVHAARRSCTRCALCDWTARIGVPAPMRSRSVRNEGRCDS